MTQSLYTLHYKATRKTRDKHSVETGVMNTYGKTKADAARKVRANLRSMGYKNIKVR